MDSWMLRTLRKIKLRFFGQELVVERHSWCDVEGVERDEALKGGEIVP